MIHFGITNSIFKNIKEKSFGELVLEDRFGKPKRFLKSCFLIFLYMPIVSLFLFVEVVPMLVLYTSLREKGFCLASLNCRIQ